MEGIQLTAFLKNDAFAENCMGLQCLMQPAQQPPHYWSNSEPLVVSGVHSMRGPTRDSLENPLVYLVSFGAVLKQKIQA